jgi:anti-anti-sigma factor
MSESKSQKATHVSYRLFENDIHLVSIVGRLDKHGAQTIEPGFAALTAYRGWRAIIDLSGVPFLSSYGLRMLLSNGKVLQRNGGEMHLAGASKSVREVLRLTGFEDILPTHDDLEMAVKALKS